MPLGSVFVLAPNVQFPSPNMMSASQTQATLPQLDIMPQFDHSVSRSGQRKSKNRSGAKRPSSRARSPARQDGQQRPCTSEAAWMDNSAWRQRPERVLPPTGSCAAGTMNSAQLWQSTQPSARTYVPDSQRTGRGDNDGDGAARSGRESGRESGRSDTSESTAGQITFRNVYAKKNWPFEHFPKKTGAFTQYLSNTVWPPYPC